MATLTPTVSLSSLTLLSGLLKLDTSAQIDYTFSDAVADTVSITGSPTDILGTGHLVNKYVYVKNNDTTNYLKLRDNASNMWGLIEAGKWGFFTIPSGTGLKFESSAGTISIDYIIFDAS